MKSDLRISIENAICLGCIIALISMSIHYFISQNIAGMLTQIMLSPILFYTTNNIFNNIRLVKNKEKVKT